MPPSFASSPLLAERFVRGSSGRAPASSGKPSKGALFEAPSVKLGSLKPEVAPGSSYAQSRPQPLNALSNEEKAAGLLPAWCACLRGRRRGLLGLRALARLATTAF